MFSQSVYIQVLYKRQWYGFSLHFYENVTGQRENGLTSVCRMWKAKSDFPLQSEEVNVLVYVLVNRKKKI